MLPFNRRSFPLFVSLLSLLGACSAAEEEPTGSTEDALCSTECRSGTLNGDPLLTPVNRTKALRSDWAPQTTVLPPAYRQPREQSMRPSAAAHFMAMADAAKPAGVNLVCLSGYRSFSTQCSLFASYASTNGCEQANTFAAHAGHSEHQLGTVCDIALASSSTTFITPGGAADTWLRAHAHEHGFALSYPNDDRTLNDGYIHEPWHYRYIGVKAAAALKEKEATLPRGRLAVPVFIAGLDAAERAALEVEGDVEPAPEPPPSPPAPPVGDPPANPCASLASWATGFYCGEGLGIPRGAPGASHLYRCRLDANGRMTSTFEPCPAGCEQMSAGTPDRCR
ncbi:MAG: M15 family metallopeptidase [Labilithrix sp.]|nr:M15 family metallopeptidase [Labilithrix sp.]